MIELIKDPEVLKTLPFGEKMMGAVETLGIGLAVVFAVLILIYLSINVLTALMNNAEKKAAAAAPAPAAAPKAAPAPVAEPEPDYTEEIMAAIFAAITEMEGNANFKIVNVKQVSTSSNWISTARSEAFASRGSQLR